MLNRSKIIHNVFEKGNNVAVPIPAVDRAPGDSQNMICVVLENKNGMVKIGNEHEIINSLYSLNESTLLPTNFLTAEDMFPKNQSL